MGIKKYETQNFVLIINECEEILDNDNKNFAKLISLLVDSIPKIKIIIVLKNIDTINLFLVYYLKNIIYVIIAI